MTSHTSQPDNDEPTTPKIPDSGVTIPDPLKTGAVAPDNDELRQAVEHELDEWDADFQNKEQALHAILQRFAAERTKLLAAVMDAADVALKDELNPIKGSWIDYYHTKYTIDAAIRRLEAGTTKEEEI